MGVDNFTCKLPILESDNFCILNSEWTDQYVSLTFVHGAQAWSGKFQVNSNEDAAELIDHLSITEEKYIKETKNALTTHGGAENFAYTIENDIFTWKKSVGKKMAVKFGFVHLEKVQIFNAFESIIDNTLKVNLSLKEQLNKSVNQIECLVKENQLLKSKIDDLIEKKNEMETTLYSQFLYLLNEKKKRIGELQKKLDPCAEDESTSGLNQSDSDPFGTDTELDSDEEGKHVAESGGSFYTEDESIQIPTKRLKKPGINENVAGPSGLNKQMTCNQSQTKSKTNSVDSFKKNPPRASTQNNKSEKFSSVLGNLKAKIEKSNSEEEAFTFPKRSKRTNGVKLLKPSSSKIKYESDDDDLPLEKVQKIEVVSDSTPSDIDPVEVINKKDLLDSENTKEKDIIGCETNKFDSKEVMSDNTPSNIGPVEVIDEKYLHHIEKSEDKDTIGCETNEFDSKCGEKVRSRPDFKSNHLDNNLESFKAFSSSTMDILNQLI